MIPIDFPQTNTVLKSPPDLEGSCQEIRAYQGEVVGGIWDGSQVVVTAWKPSPEELEELNNGGSVFLHVMGGLPPHYVCTSFEEGWNIG